jgi:hypothetical protein
VGLRKLLRWGTSAEDGEPSRDIADWLAYDENLGGGYVITADPQVPTRYARAFPRVFPGAPSRECVSVLSGASLTDAPGRILL